MNHEVRTYNKAMECVYTNNHQTAESAYEEYTENIRIIKKHINKGEEITVVRLNDGAVVAIETIKG